MAFFSSFGQTFLISLFVPGILESFEISNVRFGSIYSLATLIAGITMIWAGAQIDHIPLKKYALIVAFGLFSSALILSFSHWVWMLFIGFIGIRLFGQGLCSHTAHTSMARYFITLRGKALGIANLGFTFGEAAVPVSVAALIGIIGWRYGWSVIALVILIIMPGLILILLKKKPEKIGEQHYDKKITGKSLHPDKEKQWRRSRVLRDYRFYLILPASLVSPFLLTGLFLYQTQLASYKGWNIELMATAFIGFALAKAVFSLVSGGLIDRFKATRIFPFILIPLFTGILLLSLYNHPVIVFFYLILAGITEGFGFNVKTALYAELYGISHLGAIRSMMTMLMVFSTALSPILAGYLLDGGVLYTTILYGAQGVILLAMIPAIFIFRE